MKSLYRRYTFDKYSNRIEIPASTIMLENHIEQCFITWFKDNAIMRYKISKRQCLTQSCLGSHLHMQRNANPMQNCIIVHKIDVICIRFGIKFQ